MISRARGRMPISELEERIDAIELAQTDECRDLVSLAGLDYVRDLRFGDFTVCNFDGQDLRGFDFTGCDLRGSTFDGAWIETANFDCTMFDPGAPQKATDYDAFLKRDLARDSSTRHRVNGSRLRDLAVFREAPFAPEMVVIPAGEFMMGSDVGRSNLGEDDQPYDDEIVPGQGKRLMRIPRHFAIGRYPVTFEEYDVFCEATRRAKPSDKEWGRGRRPVTSVSWEDAQGYVAWLNVKLVLGGAAYRLPSEAEWEYACRAGTNTRRWWGDAWDPKRANGGNYHATARTSPVDHFAANSWGLHDMIGNVWELCSDVWVNDIGKLPQNGSPFNQHTRANSRRAMRGGSFGIQPRDLRSAFRDKFEPHLRYLGLGFRLFRRL